MSTIFDQQHLRLQRAKRWVRAAEQGLVPTAAATEALAEIERQLASEPKIVYPINKTPPIAA